MRIIPAQRRDATSNARVVGHEGGVECAILMMHVTIEIVRVHLASGCDQVVAKPDEHKKRESDK